MIEWDEADEPQGWGETANADLLDAIEAGLDGLRRYAVEIDETPDPTDAELSALLDEAARDADDHVESEDHRHDAEVAVKNLRAELAAAPSYLVVA